MSLLVADQRGGGECFPVGDRDDLAEDPEDGSYRGEAEGERNMVT